MPEVPELGVELAEPDLRFAAPQPPPAPPTTPKGRAEAAMQMRQTFDESYTQDGGEAVDGTQPDRDGSQV